MKNCPFNDWFYLPLLSPSTAALVVLSEKLYWQICCSRRICLEKKNNEIQWQAVNNQERDHIDICMMFRSCKHTKTKCMVLSYLLPTCKWKLISGAKLIPCWRIFSYFIRGNGNDIWQYHWCLFFRGSKGMILVSIDTTSRVTIADTQDWYQLVIFCPNPRNDTTFAFRKMLNDENPGRDGQKRSTRFFINLVSMILYCYD